MPGFSRLSAVLLVALAGCGGLYPPTGSSLGVGKAAPEIDGRDAEGRTFKLSDYRGKVVMLNFWHST